MAALPLITGLGSVGWVIVAAAVLCAAVGLALTGQARPVLRPTAAAA